MEGLVNNIFNNYYKDKKVFITGHTGFKGAWLITWLFSMGAQIKGYALPPENDACIFNEVISKINIENINADIRNKEKLINEIKIFQPDFIFHLAAQPLVRRSYQIPSETFEINTIGTANVLEAVTQLTNKCIVIVITTDKVYNNKETHYCYKETDRLGGYDPYSASKAAAEIVVESFRNSFFNPMIHSTHQKKVVTVRAGNVIGGGDWNKDRLIPDIIKSLCANIPVEIRNPDAIRPWQHVLEPLYGYLLLGFLLDKTPSSFPTTYNFGPLQDDHLTVRDFVNLAIKCWGSGTWINKSEEQNPHEANLLKLDINKALSELNWKPRLTSSEAIRWTIDWYKQPKKNIFDYTMQQIAKYSVMTN